MRVAALLLACCCGAAQAETQIPQIAGLTIVTAVAEKDGDYESLKTWIAREDDLWRLRYSAELRNGDGQRTPVAAERLVHDADVAEARAYRHSFEDGVEEDYPGTTATGVSRRVLDELRNNGSAAFSLIGGERWMQSGLSTASGLPDPALLGALTRDANLRFKGELQRLRRDTLAVLVNQQARSLPVIVASGRFTAKNGAWMDAELSLLDDDGNPLALQWKIGKAVLRVVRIDLPQPPQTLGDALRKQQRIALPGLYFDSGSAVLRPESRAALATIAAALRALPDAELTLDGHTDNVGAAAGNQALSQARAEAVRAALIAIDPALRDRLRAQGFGATRAIADNTTLEGRARNRRVELALPR